MYEHGMRLGREVPGKQGLQRQAQCYLSALNSLRLVKPEYAWIIKPNPLPRAQVRVSYFCTAQKRVYLKVICWFCRKKESN